MSKVNKTKFLPPYGVLTSMIVMYLLDKFFPVLTWQNTRIISYLLLAGSFLCILYCAYIFYKNKTEPLKGTLPFNCPPERCKLSLYAKNRQASFS